MKALQLCSLVCVLGCLPVAAVVVPVLPAPVVGSYQALLFTGNEATGAPAGLVTLTTTSTGKATGKLTTDENKTYSFNATFSYAPDQTPGDDLEGTAAAALISIPRVKLTSLGLSLTILNNTSGPVLKVILTEPSLTNRIADSGFKNATFAAKTSADYAGKYTLALEAASVPATGEPQGSGYATGTVSSAGLLTLTGKTGDGTAFTGSLPAGPNRNFVAYLNPYKIAGSFFAGKINLVSRTPAAGFHAVAAVAPGADFQWKKAAKALDKSYPSGFGALGVLLTMEPWAPLAAKQTLAQAYGLTAGQIFDIAFSSNFNTTTYSSKTPTSLGLDAKNAFYVADGGNGSPSPLVQANWAKFFTIKVNVATGAVTGSLTITDSIPQPPPKLPKTVTRKLTIEGVMLRPATIGSDAFAAGFVSIPPIDAKTGTTVTAAFTFNGPFKTDVLAAGITQIAGKYRADFDLIKVGTGAKPASIPDDDATVNFSIAADLKTMIFNGRSVPLLSDSRPNNLIFMSSTSPRLEITITLSPVDSSITKCDANYYVLSGFSMTQFSVASKNNPSQTIVKVP